jgi:transposase
VKPDIRPGVHSAEFNAQVTAACRRPGVSVASVAMPNGINANLAQRWVLDLERGAGEVAVRSARPSFVPVQLPPPIDAVAADIRVEVSRGPMKVSVSWPGSAAAACATCLREFLR